MGFGQCLSYLEQDVASRVMLNVGVTSNTFLKLFVWQWCTLSPLFVCSGDSFLCWRCYYELQLMMILWACIFHGEDKLQLVAPTLANESFCFYKPHMRIFRHECSYRINSRWHLDSILNGGSIASSHVLSKKEFGGQWWQGFMVGNGSIFWHLGYPW